MAVAFAELQSFFDPRIGQAIRQEFRFQHATLIQSESIPVISKGQDVLLRGRTGSGKTIAFGIPLIQRVLERRRTPEDRSGVAVVIVPSKDLSQQVAACMKTLCRFLSEEVSVVDTCSTEGAQRLGNLLAGTPQSLAKALQRMKRSDLAENLRMVVIDEADSVLSFGYKDEMAELLKLLPPMTQRAFQVVLCSATLNSDVKNLKALWLNRPVSLKLEEPEAGSEATRELYLSEVEENDRYLVAYFLLKSELLPKKILIFANSVKRAYGLQMFLDRFSIRTAVLSPTLPARSRAAIILAFNQGVVDVLIAAEEGGSESDLEDDEEVETLKEEEEEEEDEEMKELNLKDEDDDDDEEEDTTDLPKPAPRRIKSKTEKDPEFFAHRGLDLEDVATVFNFDAPRNLTDYTHRVGRTNRGDKSGGVAITIFSTTSDDRLLLKKRKEDNVSPLEANSLFQRLELDVKMLESFRYRVEDVSRSVGKRRIASSMLREVQLEALHSEKLEKHFVENPSDRTALRKATKRMKTNSTKFRHLDVLPSYLRPALMSASLTPVQKEILKIRKADFGPEAEEIIKKRNASDLQREMVQKRNKIAKQKARQEKRRDTGSFKRRKARAIKRKMSRIDHKFGA